MGEKHHHTLKRNLPEFMIKNRDLCAGEMLAKPLGQVCVGAGVGDRMLLL